jgi:hypothetical protein
VDTRKCHDLSPEQIVLRLAKKEVEQYYDSVNVTEPEVPFPQCVEYMKRLGMATDTRPNEKCA